LLVSNFQHLGLLNEYIVCIFTAMNNYSVYNNELEKQFEIREQDELATLQYRFHNDMIMLMHTFVPESLSGKGIASGLANAALNWAKEHNKKVKVYCPFVASYLKRHPEFDFLVVK
jgi:predicted GNAT family acetyltransferase